MLRAIRAISFFHFQNTVSLTLPLAENCIAAADVAQVVMRFIGFLA